MVSFKIFEQYKNTELSMTNEEALAAHFFLLGIWKKCELATTVAKLQWRIKSRGNATWASESSELRKTKIFHWMGTEEKRKGEGNFLCLLA